MEQVEQVEPPNVSSIKWVQNKFKSGQAEFYNIHQTQIISPFRLQYVKADRSRWWHNLRAIFFSTTLTFYVYITLSFTIFIIFFQLELFCFCLFVFFIFMILCRCVNILEGGGYSALWAVIYLLYVWCNCLSFNQSIYPSICLFSMETK